jgi:hypothetical protein
LPFTSLLALLACIALVIVRSGAKKGG